jgi:tetratricopeptide (TPR) repeat protein
MDRKSSSDRWKIALPGLVVVAIYGLGFAFPQSFWGLHYPSFLPPGLNYLLFAIALALAVWPFLPARELNFSDKPLSKPVKWLLMFAVAAIYGWMFNHFPIVSRCYGDAHFIFQNLDGPILQWDSEMVAVIFRPSFWDIKSGTEAYYGLVSLIAYVSSVDASVAAIWLHTACGMAFVMIWLSMVDYLFKSGTAKVLFAFLGLGAPFLLVFFGHFEVYPLPIVLNLAYFYALVIVFKTRKRSRFIGAAVLAFFAIKFHFSNLILIPSLAMAALYVFGNDGLTARHLTWKRVFITTVIPICLLGAIFYFFITQSAFGPRQFTEDTLEEVIFLPLAAAENAPYNHYNLLSGTHFFDAFNMLFLLSAGGMVLIAVAFWLRPFGIDGRSPLVVVLGTTLGLYLLAFFVFNPLMSMPFDWDLMSLPGPAMLVFSAVLWRKVDDQKLYSGLLGPVLGLTLLGTSGWWVNSNPAALSQRLEQSSYHAFRTYRVGISSNLLRSIELDPDSSNAPQRLKTILDRLEPYAVPEFDIEYAALLNRMAKLQEQELNSPDKVFEYYDASIKYWPWNRDIVYKTVIGHFMKQDYEKAAVHLPLLVKIKAPDLEKALRIAIHTSLEAAQYPEAEDYCRQLLEIKPENSFVREIHEALKKGDNLGELKLRFSRGG